MRRPFFSVEELFSGLCLEYMTDARDLSMPSAQMRSGPSALRIGQVPPISTEAIIMCEGNGGKHNHDAVGTKKCAVDGITQI